MYRLDSKRTGGFLGQRSTLVRVEAIRAIGTVGAEVKMP